MSLDESRFHALADATLRELMDRIEAGPGDDYEVDIQGGVMTIEAEDGAQFVLNKHAPNRQLWLSSPKSGAWHFAWNEAAWVSTRDKAVSLTEVLARDLGVAL